MSIETIDVDGNDGRAGAVQDFFETALEAFDFSGMRDGTFREDADKFTPLQFFAGRPESALSISLSLSNPI